MVEAGTAGASDDVEVVVIAAVVTEASAATAAAVTDAAAVICVLAVIVDVVVVTTVVVGVVVVVVKILSVVTMVVNDVPGEGSLGLRGVNGGAAIRAVKASAPPGCPLLFVVFVTTAVGVTVVVVNRSESSCST